MYLHRNTVWRNFQNVVSLTNVSFVKNLGTFFDRTLCMQKQASAITKSCYFQIRNIGRIRLYITEDTCKTLVCSLVTSGLDYGNVLLYGVNTNIISKLQRVQNTAARLITRSKKHDHFTPVLICHFTGFQCSITSNANYYYTLSKFFMAKLRYILRNLSVFINHKGRYGKRTPWWFNNHGLYFFLKKYFDSQRCWKKYSDFGGGKKNNMMLNCGKNFALCATNKINILTLVLSKKKILNETKNHNPPAS